MNRFVIITVGKTHSGKTTFAKALEQQLPHSLVIDQDNHAEFINTHYKSLLPEKGPNVIKYALTQLIVDYAVNQTDLHLIICNSNRDKNDRLSLLDYFHRLGFTRILVHFDLPDLILQERVIKSKRSTAIFRTATSFEEVLKRQQAETAKVNIAPPIEGEGDYLFVIKSTDQVQDVIQSIVDITLTSDV